MNQNEQNGTQKDDFWDLSDLVPKRKARPAFSPSARSVDTADVRQISHRIDQNAALDVPLPERPVRPETDLEQKPVPASTYQPQGALVREVRIYPWKNQ